MKGSEANHVDRYTKLIMEGGVNKCIICNRCLYARSVLRFRQDKYYMDMDKVLCYFTQHEHICRTCDLYSKKKKILPQAVCNKLNIPSVPCELKNVNRLERVLICRRILFKKVTIMPKGCFSTFKGAICNIPVETNDIVNVITCGADNNGLMYKGQYAKLKRKFNFRGHVYLETASPKTMQLALVYLKQNYPFWHDIRIEIGNISDKLLDFTEETDEEVPICVEPNEEGENPLHSYLLNSEEIIPSQVPTSKEIRKRPRKEAKFDATR